MHQVGLAEAGAAVEEERVEGDRPALGDAAGGGMGELVRLADHEAVEGVAAVERRGGQLDVAGGRLGVVRGGAGGGGSGRMRAGGEFGRGAGDAEFEPRGRHAFVGEALADSVAEIAGDPVADEAGGRLEQKDAVLGAYEAEGVDPVLEGVLAEGSAEVDPDSRPG
jgi:hypothetical protein